MTPAAAFVLALVTQDPVVQREFLFDQAPFASCHCSTLAESRSGLVVSWFGGTDEGSPDVKIWVSRLEEGRWTDPVDVAPAPTIVVQSLPSWNPVLFQRRGGPLSLFYKIGPSPETWWGYEMRSEDGGKTWSQAQRLDQDIMGPVRNPPIELADGTILSPTSTEVPKGSWTAQVEISTDAAATWKKIGPLNDDKQVEVIQPALLTWPGGKLQMLCRNRNRGPMKGFIIESWSEDGGKTWSPMKATELPNPNSGIAATSLKDGRAVLVYNRSPKARTPLNVAISSDGKSWKDAAVLEDLPGEYSYPTVIQTADGKVHAVYTWKRKKIRHVVLDPAKL